MSSKRVRGEEEVEAMKLEMIDLKHELQTAKMDIMDLKHELQTTKSDAMEVKHELQTTKLELKISRDAAVITSRELEGVKAEYDVVTNALIMSRASNNITLPTASEIWARIKSIEESAAAKNRADYEAYAAERKAAAKDRVDEIRRYGEELKRMRAKVEDMTDTIRGYEECKAEETKALDVLMSQLEKNCQEKIAAQHETSVLKAKCIAMENEQDKALKQQAAQLKADHVAAMTKQAADIEARYRMRKQAEDLLRSEAVRGAVESTAGVAREAV